MASRTGTRLAGCAFVASVIALAGYGPRDVPQVTLPSSRAPVEDLAFLQPESIGRPIEGHPWMAHVTARDLDGDGRMDLLACDAQANTVGWLRQDATGRFEEQIIGSGIPGPVHGDHPALGIGFHGASDLVVAEAWLIRGAVNQ